MSSNPLKIKVINAVGHRNGICGIGFYAVDFTFHEDGKTREAIATVSFQDVENFRKNKPHDPSTRVLMLCDAGGVDIEQTMRGDHFHDELCKFLIAGEDKLWTI
jgi:hypothetical protein